MTACVPLIRTAAVVPWIRWLADNGRPVAERLAAEGLTYLRPDDPQRPVPVLGLVDFIRAQSHLEGFDAGCRVISNTSICDLADLGVLALNTCTPRDAIARISLAMSHHCTHEVITVQPDTGGLIVREHWAWSFDQERLHFIQLYVAALIEALCRLSGHPGPVFEHVRLVPHPEAGFEHLANWFDGRAAASGKPVLELRIRNEVADASLRTDALDFSRKIPDPEEWVRLRGDGTLAASVLIAASAMLDGGAPSLATLSACAGISPRSLQRRLAEEGTSVGEILDRARRTAALERLRQPGANIARIAGELGYANASALTRATRRWTGHAPRNYRNSVDTAGGGVLAAAGEYGAK